MKKLFAKFYNCEALTNTYNNERDLHDPSSINIYVIDENEARIATPKPIRLSQGIYIAWLEEDILESNKVYEALWVYEIHAGSQQVYRKVFIYNKTPPTIAGYCYVYGNIDLNGYPVASAKVSFATLKNGYSSHFSTKYDFATTDMFGDWGVSLPQGTTISMSIPDTKDNKFFVVPAVNSISFDAIPALQENIITDSFGNLV